MVTFSLHRNLLVLPFPRVGGEEASLQENSGRTEQGTWRESSPVEVKCVTKISKSSLSSSLPQGNMNEQARTTTETFHEISSSGGSEGNDKWA